MRLFVQGCLIVLFIFSLPAHANNPVRGSIPTYQNCKGPSYNYNISPQTDASSRNLVVVSVIYDGMGSKSGNTNCYEFSYYACPVSASHYTGTKDQYGFPLCVKPKEPEDCFESGQVFDPNTKECTLSCPNGQLNGQCLENPQSNCDHHSSDFIGYVGSGGSAVCGNQVTECNAAGGQFGIFNGSAVCVSEDYGPPPICGPNEVSVYDTYGFTCGPILGGDGNPQWQDGEPNEDTDGDGIPDTFNPNLLNNYEMLQMVGGNIFNQNNHIINQNNITNHNLTNINNSVNNLNQTINQQGEQANQNLEGIAGILGQIAGDVSDIATNGIPGTGDGSGGDGGDGGDGTGDGTGEGEGVELGTIEGLLGDANDKQDGTNEKLDKIIDGEEGGLSTEGLGDAPGFGDSIGRLQTAFFDHPTIQKVTTLPSLAEGSSCPVFTIPANDYWDALTMDMHCTVLEDYRGMLSGMFLFFWTVLAIFAFLRA